MSIGIHLLAGKNPYNDKFPQFTNNLILEIESVLGVMNRNAKRTYDDIVDIDIRLMQKEDKLSETFVNKYLLHFTAYVGEILISETNGHWVMDFDEESQIWEPCIKVEDKKVIIAVWVYDGLFNDEVPSLSSVCYVLLGQLKLRK